MREKILNELYRQEEGYISGSEMAERLGITRVAVWKHIEALKAEGYDIEAVSGRGYVLKNKKDVIVPAAVKEVLKTRIFGRNIIYYNCLDSTNEEAKRILKKNEIEEGTVITALKQTSGRGRLQRRWESPVGGLWFSLVLHPILSVSEIALLSLVFAAGLCNSLSKFLPDECYIKWPNDVYYQDKKIAGILLELNGEIDTTYYLIAGIGINVNLREEDLPLAVRETATSLYIESGREHDINRVLAEVLEGLESCYLLFLENGFAPILDKFKDRCMHLGKKVMVKRGERVIEGINEDIDLMGNMLINTGKEIIRVSTGDVSIIGL
ncbi:biotin--[acetyl-CoA-carboxylase] ligase [Thermosyntropha sp.]|uniref:biotin--[acetyl-CoA-carboxylase] ligase n=1 Tax=Thermosyntropha sp. TaxID=2740820 RepID=UPI0025D99CF7|nr:biotin--[acetyl-CoA-carboxylase] ligase [Thermosyntropha sp.]MBO8159437.1 biotin--[acetyl-CoA-carboxylase] ligase [Thermosyntropha sp.]